MIVRAALAAGARTLQRYSDSPRLDAEVLLAFTMKRGRASLLTHPERRLTAGQARRFLRLIARRKQRRPIPYLTGRVEFFGLDFAVTPQVLIPRPATELLVEAVLRRVAPKNRLTFADVGTGSGAIAVTLARHLSKATILASDVSPAALTIAKRNADVHRVRSRIIFRRGSLLEPFYRSPRPDIIIANLPYLTANQMRHPTLRHEPPIALDGGRAGLLLIDRLLDQLAGWPVLTGLALEADPDQVAPVRRRLRRTWPEKTLAAVSDGRATRGLILWTATQPLIRRPTTAAKKFNR